MTRLSLPKTRALWSAEMRAVCVALSLTLATVLLPASAARGEIRSPTLLHMVCRAIAASAEPSMPCGGMANAPVAVVVSGTMPVDEHIDCTIPNPGPSDDSLCYSTRSSRFRDLRLVRGPPTVAGSDSFQAASSYNHFPPDKRDGASCSVRNPVTSCLHGPRTPAVSLPRSGVWPSLAN